MMTQTGTFESGWDKSFVSAEGKDVIVIGDVICIMIPILNSL